MSCTCISSSKILKELRLVLTRLIKCASTLKELIRIDNANCTDSLNSICRDLLVLSNRCKAANKVLLNLRLNGLVNSKTLLTVELQRACNELLEVKVGGRTDQRNDTNCCTTNSVRIGRASWWLVDSKDAADGIKLVSNSYKATNLATWELVAGKARTIVLANSCSYIALLASSLCVVTTHDALLASELDNCLADKVCLSKMSGASSKLCLFLAGCLVERNLCSKSLHTLGLLQNCAKLLLENNSL